MRGRGLERLKGPRAALLMSLAPSVGLVVVAGPLSGQTPALGLQANADALAGIAAPVQAFGAEASPRTPGLKSEWTAFHLSLLGTVAPVVLGATVWALTDGGDLYNDDDHNGEFLLIYGGLVVGPALGYWYAGAHGRGWLGIGLRTFVSAGSVLLATAICPWDCTDPGAGLAVVMGGGIGLLSSLIYDVASVKRRVRERNDRTLAQRLSLTPLYSSAHGPGVRVSLPIF